MIGRPRSFRAKKKLERVPVLKKRPQPKKTSVASAPKKPAAARPRPVSWNYTITHWAQVERDGHRFVATITPGMAGSDGRLGWGVLGLMTTEEVVTLDGILDSHAHQNLGTFASEQKAKRVAKEFLFTQPVPSATCPCEPVEVPVKFEELN